MALGERGRCPFVLNSKCGVEAISLHFIVRITTFVALNLRKIYIHTSQAVQGFLNSLFLHAHCLWPPGTTNFATPTPVLYFFSLLRFLNCSISVLDRYVHHVPILKR